MERNLNNLEISNSELIFWNVETNKLFRIVSNTDGSVACSENEETKLKSIENDLSKNIEEIRKILETDTGEVDDDVEEEMRKMFDENITESIMKNIDQNQSKKAELPKEETQMDEDLASFQLEESHYEQIIEIASEQLVESGQTDAPTLCRESENVCEIVLNNEGNENNKHVSTVCEQFQTENVKSIIAGSIDEKRERLQQIRNRISKIHIQLNKKRKYYETVDANSQNCGTETPSQTLADNQTNRTMNQKAIVLKRIKFKRNSKRNYQSPNILSNWRSKFEKEIRNNMNQMMKVPNKSLKVKKAFNIITKQCPVRSKVIKKTDQKIKNKYNNCKARQHANKLKTSIKRKFELERKKLIDQKEEMKEPKISFEIRSKITVKKIREARGYMEHRAK
jgi:hypothetical protein